VITACVVVVAAAALFARNYLFRDFTPLDSPEGRAFGEAVPQYLIEDQANLRAGGTPEAQKGRASAVLDEEQRKAVGPEVASRLEDLLRATVDVEAAGRATDEIENRFAQQGILLDQAMVARKLPYFVDASLIRFSGGKVMPILYSYYIERENGLSGADKPVRSLFVRRLDKLNYSNAAIGYTKPSSTAALVLLDDVESHLIEFVLPAGAAGDDTLLVDLDSIDPKSAWQKDLRARTVTVVKSAYSDLPGATVAQIDELGAALYRRRALVRSWMGALDKQQRRLRIPRRFIPESDYANELVGRIPLTELREWRAIHERLMQKEMLRTFDAVVLRHALSVEQHEAQHRLDYERARVIVPASVRELLGVQDEDAAMNSDQARSTAREVSAYLAEIARAEESPALGLMTIAQAAFNRDSWGGAHCYAALVVIDGMAVEVGAGPSEPLIGRGQIDRALLTKRFLAVTDKPEPEVRAAALRLWERWFEAKLPEVKQISSAVHPAWRH
jgi:hypothetical protein